MSEAMKKTIAAGAAGAVRPRVVERRGERRLYFDRRHVQSAMRLDDPHALVLPYTRYMMACLLFAPTPADILIAGLGGGSLPRFCHRYLPGCRVTAVEISEEIIALREHFQLPDDPRLRIIHADALDFFAGTRERFDIILLDAFDADGISESFVAPPFYPAVASCLKPAGVLCANLTGDRRRWDGHLNRLWGSFNRRVRVLPVPEEPGQYLALAFHDPDLYRNPVGLKANARALAGVAPLDFDRLLKWLVEEDGAS